MAKVVVEIRVKVGEVLAPGERVFISGNVDELGKWLPSRARVLRRKERSRADCSELEWGEDLLLPLCDIEYRYFIGTLDENESYDEKSINISTWESHIYPRKLNILDRIQRHGIEDLVETYGLIDDHIRLLRGWLTDQTAVLIRLFGNSIKLYQTRKKDKKVFLKCHYFQMNRNHHDEEEDSEQTLDNHLAKVSNLTDEGCIPHYPPEEGTEYDGDYLSFHVETMDLEDVGIEIEVRQLSKDISRPVTPLPFVTSHSALSTSSNGFTEILKIIPEFSFVGTARLSLMPSKRTVKSISIYNKHNRPVGEIKIDFLAIFPLMGHHYIIDKTFQMYWKHRKTLKVGHKGSGTSYGHTTKMSAVRENTIYSLKNAFQHGADFVEFDVQLSKDKVPVLYHDFKVCTVLRKKRGNDLQFLEVPVKDLTLADLQALKLAHTSAMKVENPIEIMNMEDFDPTDLQPFPTLQDCLEQVEPLMGFNIELKYPQHLKSGEHEQTNFFDRNVFVDKILNVVAEFSKNRRLIFSCFDADVCLMLSLKQNKYPIIFLTQGDTTEFEAYKDPRTQTLENSLFFAKSCNILGLCALTTNVADNIYLLKKILDMKLILFLWGESNNDLEAQEKWIDLGVHGIIFDRIHEFQENGAQNVYVLRSGIDREGSSSTFSEL